jgi:hypothetical protein
MEYIYTVSCKDSDGLTVLKSVFKNKNDAIHYTVQKLDSLLKIISDEYKDSEERILPMHSSFIYTMYNMKPSDEKYEYFLENYKQFYRGISRNPIMFFVSEHTLI